MTTPEPSTDGAVGDRWVDAAPDDPPTPEEAAAAERAAGSVTDDVREAYEEMAEIGAEVKGEGQIEP